MKLWRRRNRGKRPIYPAWQMSAGSATIPDVESCAWLARGNCAASVDGYCIGGTEEGKCHG